jgi:hypothetical protein
MSRPVKRYITLLRHAIRATFGCNAVHLETFEVVEVFQGKVVWEGNVELFKLYREYYGQGCFAWGFFDDKAGWEATVVLQKPPIRTAEDAVRAAIVKQAKEAAGEASSEP